MPNFSPPKLSTPNPKEASNTQLSTTDNIIMAKSFLQKYGPSAIARGLWGNGPIPTRYVILFVGQGVIFTMAMFIRSKDVEKAQHVKKMMEEAEQSRAELRGEGNSKSLSSKGDEDR